MIPGLFNDVTSRAIRTALSGLTARQETISNNVANIDTPEFRASQVTFESNLRQALALDERRSFATRLVITNAKHIPGTLVTDLERVQPAVSLALNTPARNDGNDVDIDKQMSDLAETQIRYNSLVNTVNSRLRRLRLAITEGR